MLYLGCHLSAAGGNFAMVKTAQSIGANTFAFFTRNPRGSRAKAEDPQDAARAVAALREQGFGKLVAHGAYTMNLCTGDADARAFAADILADDLRRMTALPGNFYNFHPGSHVGQGLQAGVEYIASAVKAALSHGYPVTVLLETMAGKGTEIGGKFEELCAIIDLVRPEIRHKIGVCLDTCHVSDGGYDIAGDTDGVVEEFDRVIGLDRLRAIHLNDSKNPLGAHKDRHEKIGEGFLGIEGITRIICHPKLRHLPFYLETPNEIDGYAKEIALLRGIREEK